MVRCVPQKPYELLYLTADNRKRKRKIRKIDTRVPLRSEKRESDDTEIHSIVGMLNALPPHELSYPIRVVHCDRPDFLLKTATHQIGVEITEAVSQNTAKMDSMRELEPSLTGAFYFPRKASPGEKEIRTPKLKKMLESNNPGAGWDGNGAKEWAEAIAHFVKIKVEKSYKADFERFEQNWLLIYDNWDEPALRQDLADDALLKTLREMNIFQTFGRVLVMDDNELASFTAAGFIRRRRPRHMS